MPTSERQKKPIGRFAPSPTGRMHAGNIFAALMSWLIVKADDGEIVLRIDDLDRERSRDSYANQVMCDFEMLGLIWDRGPFWQKGRDEAYAHAYQALVDRDLVYPCFCTRADLRAASAPHRGEKVVYSGTCKGLSPEEVKQRMQDRNPAWRVSVPEYSYEFADLVQGPFSQDLARDCGDFVVKRSDGLFAYQLATVVDDAEQGINTIVRGMDLLVSTPQQMFLQDVLGYERARYAHVPLLVGEIDRRLSKRDKDAGMDELLARFKTPAGVLGHIAFVTGLIDADEPATCEELLASYDPRTLSTMFPDKVQILWQ